MKNFVIFTVYIKINYYIFYTNKMVIILYIYISKIDVENND